MLVRPLDNVRTPEQYFTTERKGEQSWLSERVVNAPEISRFSTAHLPCISDGRKWSRIGVRRARHLQRRGEHFQQPSANRSARRLLNVVPLFRTLGPRCSY